MPVGAELRADPSFGDLWVAEPAEPYLWGQSLPLGAEPTFWGRFYLWGQSLPVGAEPLFGDLWGAEPAELFLWGRASLWRPLGGQSLQSRTFWGRAYLLG